MARGVPPTSTRLLRTPTWLCHVLLAAGAAAVVLGVARRVEGLGVAGFMLFLVGVASYGSRTGKRYRNIGDELDRRRTWERRRRAYKAARNLERKG